MMMILILGHCFSLRHYTRRVHDALGWITMMKIWRVKGKMDESGYWSSFFNMRFSIDNECGCGSWVSGAGWFILEQTLVAATQDHWGPGAVWTR